MVRLTPEQQEEFRKATLETERRVDKLTTKVAASKYTTAIFLVAIVILLCIGASVPYWFN